MLAKIQKLMPYFKDAVLTGVDEEGFPFSIRCEPKLDKTAGVMKIQRPRFAQLNSGSACLLFHTHDERLWSLKSFLLVGNLSIDENPWVFRPERFVPGVGVEGIPGYIKFVFNGRKLTRQYLKQRNLSWPTVAWDEISAWLKDAQEG